VDVKELAHHHGACPPQQSGNFPNFPSLSVLRRTAPAKDAQSCLMQSGQRIPLGTLHFPRPQKDAVMPRLGVASGIFFSDHLPIVAIQRKRQTHERIEARPLEVGAEDDGIFYT